MKKWFQTRVPRDTKGEHVGEVLVANERGLTCNNAKRVVAEVSFWVVIVYNSINYRYHLAVEVTAV